MWTLFRIWRSLYILTNLKFGKFQLCGENHWKAIELRPEDGHADAMHFEIYWRSSNIKKSQSSVQNSKRLQVQVYIYKVISCPNDDQQMCPGKKS